MVTDQGRKTFYKLISATILMENMLTTRKEQGGTLPGWNRMPISVIKSERP